MIHLFWTLSCKLGYHISFLDCPLPGMTEFTQMWKRKLFSLSRLVCFFHELLFVVLSCFVFIPSLSLGISKPCLLNQISSFSQHYQVILLLGATDGVIKHCRGRMCITAKAQWISCSLWHYTEFKTLRAQLSLCRSSHVSCLLPKPIGEIKVYATAAYLDLGREEIISSSSLATQAGWNPSSFCSQRKVKKPSDGSTGSWSRMKGAVSHSWGL